MDPMNGRLCTIFEMLIDRLDKLETKLDAVADKTDHHISLAARHIDSMRPLGEPFSGVALTGECVALTIHNEFDSNGNFLCDSGDILLLMTPDYELESIYQEDDVWGDVPTWEWESAVRTAWGDAEFERVRARMIQHRLDDETSVETIDTPTCAELGIMSDTCELHTAILNISLQQRFPDALVVGEYGFAASLCDVAAATNLAKRVMHHMKEYSRGGEAWKLQTLEIHVIPEKLKALALAMVSREGEQAAFQELHPARQGALFRGECGGFFTTNRLTRCFDIFRF